MTNEGQSRQIQFPYNYYQWNLSNEGWSWSNGPTVNVKRY